MPKIATVEDGEVKIGKVVVIALVALIGVLPPLLNFGLDRLLKPAAQESAIAMEAEKFDLERDLATIDLCRLALADPDTAKRRDMLRFLVTANLLNSDVEAETLLRGVVPQWPPETEALP